MGFDPGVFGRFGLAALVQPHLEFLFVLFVSTGAAACQVASVLQGSHGWLL